MFYKMAQILKKNRENFIFYVEVSNMTLAMYFIGDMYQKSYVSYTSFFLGNSDVWKIFSFLSVLFFSLMNKF